MTEMIANGPKKGRRPPWILAGLLGGLIFLILLIWLFRAALAETALSQWCAGRDLQCEAKIVDLELGHVGVERLRINSPEGQPFRVTTAEAELAWTGPFSPQVTRVVLTEPTLRARFDGEHLSLLGLESLMGGGGGGGSAPTPAIEVNDATLILETPAGEARAELDAVMDEAGDLTARFVADPVVLEEDGNRLDLREAVVSLGIVGGTPSSVARVELGGARLGGFAAGPFVLEGTFEPETGTQRQIVVWSVSGNALAYGGAEISSLAASAFAELDPVDEFTLPALRAAIASLSAEIAAEGIGGAQAADTARIEVSVSRTGQGGFEGPFEARLKGGVSAYGSAQTARFDGELVSATDGSPLEVKGAASLVGATAGDPLRGWLSSVTAPPPVDDHGRALQDVFSRALDQFDASLAFDFRLLPEGGWQLSSADAPTFEAASGLEVTVTPTGMADWLTLEPVRQRLSADVGLNGGMGPTVLLRALEAERQAGAVQMTLDELRLSRWVVDGLGLGAVLDDLTLTVDEGDTRVMASGRIDLGGNLSGVDVSGLRVSGGVEALREDGATTIRVGGANCLSYRAASLLVAGVTIGRHTAPLCPAGGVLIDGTADAPGGTFRLGDLALPVSRESIEGTLNMSNARLQWRAADGLELRLTANDLNAPLAFDDRSLVVDGNWLSTRGAFSGGPARYGFSLADATFEGEVLPANISTGEIDLSLADEASGFAGALTIPRVLIADKNPDPAYQPLVTGVDGKVSEGRLRFNGPVALERSGAEIADLSLDLELMSLIGTARIDTGELRFAPGALQPTQLSERLRGAFTNAAGLLEAEAQIEIDPSGLVGNGRVRATNFGFQTAALGRVAGINGEVVFDQLFGLSTPPGQVVTVGSVDPGLPLSDGVLRFQLVEGRQARLERATWPFAGGRLVVEPTAWAIGEPRRTVTVRAEAIDLAALGETLASEDLQIQGTVSGVFPLVLEAGSAFVRNARFLADDRGGVVRYTGAAGEQAAGANENVALAFDALKNFQYTVLELGADGDLNGEIILTVKMTGKNPEVLSGIPFAFNVSVDSRLGELLQSSRNLSSSDWLADIVAEQIRGQDEQP